MPRGRPVGSVVRQNIVNILAVIGRAYGYQVHKVYQQIYPPCTREVIYYNLKKGVKTGEFVVDEIKTEKGEYSWGQAVEKTYYRLGPQAKPTTDERVTRHFQTQRSSA
ncbi:hypothetical protein HY490_01470 [Candidatus Woesearchaeota archaeon]|nr:hypothetical protein [Candidatus Woesearchaeota archaeon]